MSDDEDFDVYPRDDEHGQGPQQETVLSELTARLVRLEDVVARGARGSAASPQDENDEQEQDKDPNRPAPWVLYPPPPHDPAAPRASLADWVDWYNTVYKGHSTEAPAIPECWDQHPGLAAELATLAATHRQANLGKSANTRDAAYWHHVWRPGVITRMVAAWVHPRCLTGEHKDLGASAQSDRYTETSTPQ